MIFEGDINDEILVVVPMPTVVTSHVSYQQEDTYIKNTCKWHYK